MRTPVPHFLYRCYDADDRLLYIGCARDVAARLGVHLVSWSNPASAALNLRMVRHTEVECPDKATARAAERQAIYDEEPLLNSHHQRVMRRPAHRRADIEAYLQATQPEHPGLMAKLTAMFTPRDALPDG